MKRTTLNMTAAIMTMTGLGMGTAVAGEASTSATASNGWSGRGTTAATANYTGDDNSVGIARTRTNSTGNVNTARGLAVGVDEDGLDFSFSHAIASKFGPAYAGTLNLSVGRDGEVSGSYGNSTATGGTERSATASGVTRVDRRGGTSSAVTGGDTRNGGTVRATSNSYNSDSRRDRIDSRSRTRLPDRIRRVPSSARSSWR